MTSVAPSAVAEPLTESQRRARLGIPADAERVMVVTESTHWDPNWLITSQEYFSALCQTNTRPGPRCTRRRARRVFSLECTFFPDLYWDQRPSRRVLFRTLVNEGRLRFTGSGVTTPDTLLPEDEILLRDLLVGQEWLRVRGMTQEPRVLYLPDSFGHSPGTPSLLAAADVPYAAICRIDGMRFPGADMESPAHFPRPGTSAAHLIESGTADFIWRGPDGSEVLTHWMAHGYGHGDLLASGGLSRALGLPLAWPDRRAHHVANRIEGYIAELSPLARTPYLLLAIGLDFVHPIPRLVELLDRWNETSYERTGVWVVNAGLDDYFDLIANHRDRLPRLSLDPNPYWMGFYATRSDLKSACRNLGRKLLAADNEQARLSIARTSRGTEDRPDPVPDPTSHGVPNLTEAWWRAVTSNHHDFITGTAPNRVSHGEQEAWLSAAMEQATEAVPPAVDSTHPEPTGAHQDHTARSQESDLPRSWTREGDRVTVCIGSRTAVFDAGRGGALVSLIDEAGNDHMVAPSLELRSYTESGGLWRMGHEFTGGRWLLTDRSTRHLARIHVDLSRPGVSRVVITALLDNRPAVLIVTLSAHSPAILVHTMIASPNRRTITLAVRQRETIASLRMHQPGGMVTRDLRRFYDPTFWPLHSFASTGTMTLATGSPTALHATEDGLVEVVVARTAVKEIAHGIVPVMAPAWGHGWATQHGNLAIGWTTPTAHGHRNPNDLDRTTLDDGHESRSANAIQWGRELARHVDLASGRAAPDWLFTADDPIVEVIAVKVAQRGTGIIVRLRSWAQTEGSRPVSLRLCPTTPTEIHEAWLTDSRERDRSPLPVSNGAVHIDVDRGFATVRVVLV